MIVPNSTGKRKLRGPRGNPAKDVDFTLEECFEPDKKKRKPVHRSTAHSQDNESARQAFLSAISESDRSNDGKPRGTFVTKWMLRALKNSTEALVLAQLIYWTGKGNQPQPRRGLNLVWVAKTAQDLASELCRKQHEIDRALSSLEEQKLISWEVAKFGGQNCRHISIVWRQIESAYQRSIAESSSSCVQE